MLTEKENPTSNQMEIMVCVHGYTKQSMYTIRNIGPKGKGACSTECSFGPCYAKRIPESINTLYFNILSSYMKIYLLKRKINNYTSQNTK